MSAHKFECACMNMKIGVEDYLPNNIDYFG